MYIGSGDVSSLLSGKETESFKKLLQRFVSGEQPYYNAKNSPIDAFRTGALLEDRYLGILPEDYYSQIVVVSKDMDVFKASLDFAQLDKGEVVDFDELKTCSLDDFLPLHSLGDRYPETIKKSYKKYYNQVQEQLYCSGLDSCNLVFLVVYSYVDEENRLREIKENEYIKFRIRRDEDVIKEIKYRGMFFQRIKDYFSPE
jgi:hypothetical protein